MNSRFHHNLVVAVAAYVKTALPNVGAPGSVIPGTEFGGGRKFDFLNGMSCYSANITPDKKTGLGSWNKETFIQRFQQYSDTFYHPSPVGSTDFNTALADVFRNDTKRPFFYFRISANSKGN